MCPVYTWWNSLETALVTGSLLFVTPGCRLAELSDCEFVLRVSCVSADLCCEQCFSDYSLETLCGRDGDGEWPAGG